MNIKRNLVGASALLLAALTTCANASSVSLADPGTISPGASFSISVFGNFDDVNGLGAGGFDVIYDDSLFQVDTFTHALSVDPDLSCPGAAGCPSFDGASPDTIAFGNFGGLIASGAGSTLLGTIEVTAIGVGTGAFSLEDNPSFTGSWLDNALNQVASPSYTGVSVTVESAVIPVPAAVWLFGSGLIGLVGMARRKKAA